eukprot:1160135-Pelagomonas_calceolata.AAC.2
MHVEHSPIYDKQDVAERLGREAKQMLLSPAVMPMDAYDVAQLPSERLLLLRAAADVHAEHVVMGDHKHPA